MCDRDRNDKESKNGPVERRSVAVWSDFCAVAPSPDLKARIKAEKASVAAQSGLLGSVGVAVARGPRRLGFDDGVILPPASYPAGTSNAKMQRAAAERAPLRGAVRVVVVLVEFSDQQMSKPASHFDDLFFSKGVLPHGSVKEYYSEATNGLVDIVGEVVGPVQLPKTRSWYANGNFGIGRPSGTARANIMAADAARVVNAHVDFEPYDNDGNGFVDAFVVVHAGSGGEATGNPADIWSHKWTLPSAYRADGKRIYAYLTIPEDAKIGVSAHELGHLLFGFPDLYDIDYSSEGLGGWCLMSGGSWNGGGDIPAHPSAWCKAQQGWVTPTNIATNGSVSIEDVKTSGTVYRAWSDGGGGSEYFLIENRQKTGYDAGLPGSGLLIWHVDESQPDNSDESHYKVALVQSDGRRDLELDQNRGDGGDPYPGTTNNTSFDAASTPSSSSYANQPTGVAITDISPSGPTMTAMIRINADADAPGDSWVDAVEQLDARVSALEAATRRAGPNRATGAREYASVATANGTNGGE